MFSDTLQVNTGISESFVIDQIPPTIEWLYPNGGEQFNSFDDITTQWAAIDSSWDGTDATIYLSYMAGELFNILADSIANTGFYSISLPNIDLLLTIAVLWIVTLIDFKNRL